MDKLKIILFGATGHIGQGVLIECLEDPDISEVLVIGRKTCNTKHAKIKEIIHQDFLDYSSIAQMLTGYDGCCWCLGVSSVGMDEQKYHRITHDFADQAAATLEKLNPSLVFCFTSGAGADETLQSKQMWARVKGKAENALRSRKFKGVYLFRPAYIHPVKGVKSTYKMYNVLGIFYPLWKLLFPKYVTTTEEFARAMLSCIKKGYNKAILENKDIIQLGRNWPIK